MTEIPEHSHTTRTESGHSQQISNEQGRCSFCGQQTPHDWSKCNDVDARLASEDESEGGLSPLTEVATAVEARPSPPSESPPVPPEWAAIRTAFRELRRRGPVVWTGSREESIVIAAEAALAEAESALARAEELQREILEIVTNSGFATQSGDPSDALEEIKKLIEAKQ